MKSVNSALTAGMIALFCERRIASVLPADATLSLQGYLTDLLVRNEFPPYRGTTSISMWWQPLSSSTSRCCGR